MSEAKGNKLNAIFNGLKRIFVQEVPSEYEACQSCDKPECDNELWENCEHRIKIKNRLDKFRNQQK